MGKASVKDVVEDMKKTKRAVSKPDKPATRSRQDERMSLDTQQLCDEAAGFLKDPSFIILQDALTNMPLRYLRPSGVVVNKSFGIDLGDLPMQDQSASGRCWIFAGINVLRRMILQAYPNEPVGVDFNLSHSFIFIHSWIEKCNSVLETAFEFVNMRKLPSAEFTLASQGLLTDGGAWDGFTQIIEKYGIVPGYAYAEARPAKASQELNDVLKRIVHVAIANMLLPPSRTATAQPLSRSAFDAIKKEAMLKVHKTLCAMLGTPPSSFVDREALSEARPGSTSQKGRHRKKETYAVITTPIDYYKTVVKPCLTRHGAQVCITNDPRQAVARAFSTQYTYQVLPPERPRSGLAALPSNIFFNLTIGAMKAAAIRALKKGHPLWFSCDINKYYDSEALLLNSKASNIGLLSGEDVWRMPKGALYNSGLIENSHAMTLVGYDEREKTWKVENSWGQESSLTMTDRWFDTFVVCVVVPDTCLEPKQRSAYTVEIGRLNQGDPIPMVPVWDIYSSPQKN